MNQAAPIKDHKLKLIFLEFIICLFYGNFFLFYSYRSKPVDYSSKKFVPECDNENIWMKQQDTWGFSNLANIYPFI